MRIEQLMNQPAITCGTSDDLNTAAKLMWDNDCGIIPVVDGGGAVVGVVTDRDIAMAAFTAGTRLADIPVSRAMATQVHACHAGDTLEQAEQIMADKQVRRVPVVDGDNRCVGMLSMNDIARHAATARTRNGITQTLAAICQPRARTLEPTHAATTTS